MLAPELPSSCCGCKGRGIIVTNAELDANTGTMDYSEIWCPDCGGAGVVMPESSTESSQAGIELVDASLYQ